MTFSFNFNVEENIDGKKDDSKSAQNTADVIKWKEAEEIFLSDDHFQRISNLCSIEKFQLEEELSFDNNIKDNPEKSQNEVNEVSDNSNENAKETLENPSPKDTKNKVSVLNFVNSGTVAVNLKSAGYEGDLGGALDDNTDLVPGVYEGGLKIWECSEDLVKYLHKEYSDNLEGCKVLEVGCGAGLPGVFAFASGASVHFNDYNKEVLEEVTIPNVLLNVQDSPDQLDESKDEEADSLMAKCKDTSSFPETRYFAGDWEHLNRLLTQDKNVNRYDLILTSETIYNPDNHQKLIQLLKDQLKGSGSGVALIAAKTYYFGVGGSIQDFQKKLEANGFEVETVFKCETGVKREILAAKLK